MTPRRPAGLQDGVRPRHSSDGVRGEIAAPLSSLPPMRLRVSEPVSWPIAPGAEVTTWSQTDGRGPIKAQLLSVKWDQPGLWLNYLGPRTVSDTDTVGDMVAAKRAIAGINGDFFDIGDTGAPLGVGKRRAGKVRHAPQAGWNATFYIGSDGVPKIGQLPLVGSVKQQPTWPITNLNSPTIAPDGIGVYTKAWGTAPGKTVIGGKGKARAILVRRNRVVQRFRKLPAGQKFRGQLLVGRNKGAKKVWRARKGDRIKVRYGMPAAVKTAVSGNKVLVSEGVIDVVDNREMHPRTAIGIDYDTREILMLVIDGRSKQSRGYTMVELANMMIDLGADEALNLDGGGSSTLVAPNQAGETRAINDPSDGRQRSVANGLGLFYRP